MNFVIMKCNMHEAGRSGLESDLGILTVVIAAIADCLFVVFVNSDRIFLSPERI